MLCRQRTTMFQPAPARKTHSLVPQDFLVLPHLTRLGSMLARRAAGAAAPRSHKRVFDQALGWDKIVLKNEFGPPADAEFTRQRSK